MGAVDLVRKDLQDGEVVTFASAMSPARLLLPGVLFVVLVAWDASLPSHDALRVVPGLALVVVAVWGLRLALEVATTRYIVTDRRVRYQRGWLRRVGSDVFAGQVSGVGSRQGVLGRALDYGEVTVRDTGGRLLSSEYVTRPHELEGAIHQLSELGTSPRVARLRVVGSPGRFCVRCGSHLASRARYCSDCGAPSA